MAWWIWMAVGLVLAALEVMTPGGLVLVFFGVGALVTGLLAVAGILPTLGLQLLAFAVLSVVSLLLFRKPLAAKLDIRHKVGHMDVDSLPGEAAVATEAMAPGAWGRVELRGSSWKAKNVGTREIPVQERCVVRAVEGLELHVAREERP